MNIIKRSVYVGMIILPSLSYVYAMDKDNLGSDSPTLSTSSNNSSPASSSHESPHIPLKISGSFRCRNNALAQAKEMREQAEKNSYKNLLAKEKSFKTLLNQYGLIQDMEFGDLVVRKIDQDITYLKYERETITLEDIEQQQEQRATLLQWLTTSTDLEKMKHNLSQLLAKGITEDKFRSTLLDRWATWVCCTHTKYLNGVEEDINVTIRRQSLISAIQEWRSASPVMTRKKSSKRGLDLRAARKSLQMLDGIPAAQDETPNPSPKKEETICAIPIISPRDEAH